MSASSPPSSLADVSDSDTQDEEKIKLKDEVDASHSLFSFVGPNMGCVEH